jgi:predicted aspartyl protease
MKDLRTLLKWDSTQYICPLGVQGKLINAIVDTGAHRTVIDTKMADQLGLKLKAGDQNCGKFSVPGSDAVHSYAGVVEGDTTIQIGPKLFARVSNLRVI